MKKLKLSLLLAGVALLAPAIVVYHSSINSEVGRIAATHPVVAAVHAYNKATGNEAALLLLDHPRLSQLCDYAGGCGNVKIECRRYDATGNTTIRNTVWVSIGTDVDYHLDLGDGWYKPVEGEGEGEGSKFRVHGLYAEERYAATAHEAYGLAVEAAIDEWQHSYDAEHKPSPYDADVVPNVTNCDETCK